MMDEIGEATSKLNSFMRPEVSVIVPSYNHAAYLEECVRSALAQDVELEVIVVDDRSKDQSVEVASSIDDSRVRIEVNEANIGAYATQNRAMDLATGEFIAVLNSDDIWWPGKLARQVTLLRENSRASFSYTLGAQIDERGLKLDVDVHGNWPSTELQELIPLLLSSNRILASSVVFRRGAVRFQETLRYTGDWVAALQLSERGPAAFVPEELTGWRQHGSNSYLRSEALTLEEILVRRSILKARKHWLSSAADANLVRAQLAECAIHLTALYVLVGDMRRAKASAGLALRLNPADKSAQKRLAVSLMPSVLARKKLWAGEKVRVPRGSVRKMRLIELGG